MSNKKQKGFTIIEVVLVLAIAGLIFLMVFIALPALQAGQRDTARKSDVSAILAAVNSYSTNNAGSLPTTAAEITAYQSTWSANTTSIDAPIAHATPAAPASGVIAIVKGSKCGTASASGMTLTSGTARQFVVVTKLEAGGGVYYCAQG